MTMRLALCDEEAFWPFSRLVTGKLETVNDLSAAEAFVRTAVLHDDIALAVLPFPLPSTTEPRRRTLRALDYINNWVSATTGPAGRPLDLRHGSESRVHDVFLELYGSVVTEFSDDFVPHIELSGSLKAVAARWSARDESDQPLETYLSFLKRVLFVVRHGGSALVEGDFAKAAISVSQRYPSALFDELDKAWTEYAHTAQDGLGLLVPPVLGIVLSRCARREAIPAVIRDLRDEWSGARKKVWGLLDSLKTVCTVGQAVEIRQELSEASRMFAPEPSEHDSRPVRVFWEIVTAASAGAGIAALSGGKPVMGAITGAMAHVPRSVPALLHEFGPAVFGRGAFDLARRVRTSTAGVEFGCLSRLLTESEKETLGIGSF